jgi:hypothetical protein
MNYLSWDESTHRVLEQGRVLPDVDWDTRAETRPQDTAMENTK